MGIKNAHAWNAERLTCALTSGLPLYVKRCKYTARNPNVQENRQLFYILDAKLAKKIGDDK